MNELFKQAKKLIDQAKSIVVLQPENPDGDSIASALALEEVLGSLGKDVVLYSIVEVPKYLRYLPGWDRITNEWPNQFDLSIIVDCSFASLLEKTFQTVGNQIMAKPAIIIDHHNTESTLELSGITILDPNAVATGEVIYELVKSLNIKPSLTVKEFITHSILSDSGNFVHDKTTAKALYIVAQFMEEGLDLYKLHKLRRLSEIKPAKILTYKGQLLERIEYLHNGTIATVTIPWSEIEEYSDQYNPSILVINEMLLVEDVLLAVSFKDYTDKKVITAKLRANAPIAQKIAEHFGGGGHPMAAGCKTTDKSFDSFKADFINYASKVIDEYKKQAD